MERVKLLRPGDPCPCCGLPLRYDLEQEIMEELSRIADYKARLDAGLRGEDKDAE